MRTALLAMLTLAALIGGCDRNRDADYQRPAPTFMADDSVTQDTVYVAPVREGDLATATTAPPQQDNVYTVDAMIGQINGRPIYASRIFEEIGEEQLRTLGSNNPRSQFIRQVAELFQVRLNAMVNDALILAEAEAGLSKQEQQGLLAMVQQFREDLISESGGFLGGAEEKLRQERGITLEQAVEEHRQEILTNKYLGETLYPRIHVNRYDVERYYDDNYDSFNPPPQLSIDLLLSTDPTSSSLIESALGSGESMADQADRQGVRLRELQFTTPIAEFDELAWDPVNEKVRTLGVNQMTDRTDTSVGAVWVKLTQLETGQGKPLRDVYLDIERLLRSQRFQQLSAKYMAELRQSGNYTPIETMLGTLLEVAVNRYSLGE